ACSLPIPSASRMLAVMLTLTIAPPAVIGSSEAAAPKQRTTRASVGEKATPSEASKTALPSARVVQQPSRKQPAAIAERVVEAERDDREGDRLQREPDASEPAQGADLDEVVEPERQDGAAGGGCTAGGQAARPVGTRAGRKQLLPAERAQDEAGEVQTARK